MKWRPETRFPVRTENKRLRNSVSDQNRTLLEPETEFSTLKIQLFCPSFAARG